MHNTIESEKETERKVKASMEQMKILVLDF
jgi:hypothetical protein